MSRKTDDPQHWRDRAARTLAAGDDDPNTVVLLNALRPIMTGLPKGPLRRLKGEEIGRSPVAKKEKPRTGERGRTGR
jgi:hypothetical protein